VLDKAPGFEEAFYRIAGIHAVVSIQVKSRLDNEIWARDVFHEDESLLVGKTFEFLARAALKAKLAYIAGKHLAMYRGEHYIKVLFKTSAP